MSRIVCVVVVILGLMVLQNNADDTHFTVFENNDGSTDPMTREHCASLGMELNEKHGYCEEVVSDDHDHDDQDDYDYDDYMMMMMMK